MLTPEEKKVFNFLKEINISEKYIYKIKELFKEEGIKFCIKTMNAFTEAEIKESVMQMECDDDRDFIKDILSDINDLNIPEVMNKLGY